MAINFHRRETNKLVLYGLLLMVLIIGVMGALFQTLDNDENLGITFLEANDPFHAEVGTFAHLTPVAPLIGVQPFHKDFLIEHVVRSLRSSPLVNSALASRAIPLRR